MTTQRWQPDVINAALEGRRVPISEIPVIDFHPFLHGDDSQRRQVAQQVGAACRNAGFFYLANHGIEPQLFSRVV